MAIGPDLRAYETSVVDGVLTITIRKEFDFGNLHQDWAIFIINAHAGPFTKVEIDLSHVGLLSSTFFAGAIHLMNHFSAKQGAEVVLSKPDHRVLRNLKIMRMDGLFTIIAR